jgi:hypothetical protein
MSAEELAVKYQWEKQLAMDAPLHRLTLVNGQRIEGRLIQETPRGLVFQEASRGGGLTTRVDRDRVAALEFIAKPAHEVTYRDVRFRMQFPTLQFLKRPPFTLASDESFDNLGPVLRALESVCAQFLGAFGPLALRPPESADIQVVFFSNEEVYRSYRKRYAPQAPFATGFYSVQLDRLVIFNGAGEEARAEIGRRLDELAESYRAESDGDAVRSWRASAEARLRAQYEEQTLATIRHEAAHQLFYTCGVHSGFRAEHDWLVEGLASYCETEPIGAWDEERARALREAQARGYWIPVAQLVNRRNAAGLQSFGAPLVDLAYRQSHALVRYLMQPERREKFFGYMDYLRQPANLREVAREPAWDLLCRRMEISPAEFDARFRTFAEASP